MDKLFSLLTTAEARKVLVGIELDVSKWDETSFRNAVSISLHCMLNGPVGVNKDTTFPVVGPGSIKSKVDPAATNRTWQNTVRRLANHIRNHPDWQGVINECQQMAIHGNIWPLWDDRRVSVK